MQRYFMGIPYTSEEAYTLTGENYHHIVRVMRMQQGDTLYAVFSDRCAIIGEITDITDFAVTMKEVAKDTMERELPIAVTIASGYPKGDKLEWVVQKGTELGAHQFLGFPAKSSVVKWDEKKLNKKQQRLTKIAREAAEQSQRLLAPAVTLLTTSQQLVSLFSEYDGVVVAYEEAAKTGETAKLVQVLKQMQPGSKLLVLFGPEGGFTSEEIAVFTASGAAICGLGPRILRTETAPLYLLSAVSYQWELLQH